MNPNARASRTERPRPLPACGRRARARRGHETRLIKYKLEPRIASAARTLGLSRRESGRDGRSLVISMSLLLGEMPDIDLGRRQPRPLAERMEWRSARNSTRAICRGRFFAREMRRRENEARTNGTRVDRRNGGSGMIVPPCGTMRN